MTHWKRPSMLRYLSPVSGAMTMTSQLCSSAYLTAISIAAPEEIPTRIPSVLASFWTILTASSNLAVSILSTTLLSSVPGIKLGPIPCILCGPALPVLMSGESAGSTSTDLRSVKAFFRMGEHPEMVPPVPLPAMKNLGLTSYCLHCKTSSGPVESLWALGLLGFSNCPTRMALGSAATISSAFLTAPATPSGGGVSMSSAP